MWPELLDLRTVRMPPFAAGDWLNCSRPLTKEFLHGRVLLIDFWDYTCVNCLRTLPYLTTWYERYKNLGFTLIGVHAPEFKFGRHRAQLETAVNQFHLQYPILLDNNYETWTQYAAKAWPTKFLIDHVGYIRLMRQGEGYYQTIEKAIQTLLRLRDPHVSLPDLLPPLRDEDTAGALCFRPSPEIFAGFQGGGLFGGGLGNPEGYYPDNVLFYKMPDERQVDRFYLEGAWKAWPEAMAFTGQEEGRVLLQYTAVSVNAVLAPSADEVELALDLNPSAATPIVEIKQDGRYLTQIQAGDDVQFTKQGKSIVIIDRPRMYQLIKNPMHQTHEIELIFRANGSALFTFSFGSCVVPPNFSAQAQMYTVS